MSADQTNIQWIQKKDIDADFVMQIVKLHSAVLPEDLTTQLGLKLRIHIFSNLIEKNGCVVAINDGNLIGFCLFSADSFLKDTLLSSPFLLTHSFVKMLLRQPSRMRELVSVGSRFVGGDSHSLRNPIEIFSFGVATDWQSQGIGSRILDVVLNKGIAKDILTKTSDGRSADFYIRNGFEIVGEELRGSRVFKILLRKQTASAIRYE